MHVPTGRGTGLSDDQVSRLTEIEGQGGAGSPAERGELRALRMSARGPEVMRVDALIDKGRVDVGKAERRARLSQHQCPECGQSLRGGS
jgi:hypothetical protein